MRTLTALALVVGFVAFARTASADLLEQKVADTKATYEKAHDLASSAAERLKIAKEALEKKESDLEKLDAVPTLKVQSTFVPWCDDSCLRTRDTLISANHKIDVAKLHEQSAPAKVLEAALNGKNAASVAELQKSLTQLVPPLASEAKALFVLACYDKANEVGAADCAARVKAIAEYTATKAGTPAPHTLTALGERSDVPEADRLAAYCGTECLKKYDELRSSDDQRLNPEKLPEVSDCQAVLDAVKAVNGNSVPLRDLTSKISLGDPEQKALLLAVCPRGNDAKCVADLQLIVDYKPNDIVLRSEYTKAQTESNTAKALEMSTLADYTKAKQEAAEASDTPVPRLADRLALVRRARCATAYCWGGDDGRRYAIEPILDLPVGMYWATGGGALARYVNANNIKIQATAGLRYWFAYDVMSVGVLLAQPSLTETQSSIDFRGKALGTSQVRRTYPTLVVGLWGDILQLSFSVDELRNGSAGSSSNVPEFAANEVLSRAITLGVAINPITAARNGIGSSNSSEEAAK